MGWQHAIAGGQGNLVATSFQSPNFVHGVSGWRVTRAGDAEFNSGTFRGPVIVGSSSFWYNGTPRPGTLAFSVAEVPGTDLYGNAILTGFVSYQATSAMQVSFDAPTGGHQVALYAAASQAGPWTRQANLELLSASFGFTGAVSFNGLHTILPPSGDATGAKDSANIASILNGGGQVQLLPATYYVKSSITLPAGGGIVGAGPASIIVPTAALAGGIMTPGGNNRLRDVRLWGGSNARSGNPAGPGIYIPAGVQNLWIADIYANYLNGWVVDGDPITAGVKGTIRGIKGTNNGAGIRHLTASGISAQIEISDVNLQQCEVSESLYLQHVFDVLVSQYNSSVLGTAGVPTMHLLGHVTTCKFHQLDCGVQGTPTAGVPVLHIEDSGGFSVTDCAVSDSTFQAGGVGVMVDGGTARCQFGRVSARNNAGDGWQFNGTGQGLAVSDCVGNGNGGAADVNVTSTAHVGLSQFTYGSTGVTNSLVVGVGNHVSNNNPTNPGGRAVSGAPAGW